MRAALQILGIVVVVAVAILLFQVVQRRLSDVAFAFTVNPEVLDLLEQSLDDQRHLARLDSQAEEAYRERFAEVEETVHRLQILAHSREDMVRRYEMILLVVFAVIVIAVVVGSVARHLRLQPRLVKVREALEALAEGRSGLQVGVPGRDVVGRIASMIEQTSRVMARDRQRLAALNNLSAWQEAARRHAHEMRTPLTGARLELERVRDLLTEHSFEVAEKLDAAAAGALEELDRLAGFTGRFTSFARLPRPQLETVDLAEVARRFVASFAAAWPNLKLELQAEGDHTAAVDVDMVRQVLANLGDNASRAVGERQGTMRLTLDSSPSATVLEVADDGPGVDASVRDRLFEPYTTTRTIGEGMGLGLAISKKIMLEHGGDLELAASSPSGAIFRLTFVKSYEEGSFS